MKKTCFNCKYFHGCLAEEEPSQYHIHNYCEIFKSILPFDMDSEVNHFLESHWPTMSKASIECDSGVNDDLETGEANCYLYKAADKEFWPDERFEANKKQNRELAIKTLEYMRSHEKFKEIPVMFLTADADIETVKEAARLGAKGYVKKPFLPHDLLERVGQVIQEKIED